MPRGTCAACGCTPRSQCSGGCHWADVDETHCSQCVHWGVLRVPPPPATHPLRGVFPHDMVPVREVVPIMAPGPQGKPAKAGVRIDLRRLDADTVLRLAFLSAPENDGTVEEFMSKAESDRSALLIPVAAFACTIGAFDLERAAAVKDLALGYVEATDAVKGGAARG